MYEIIKVNCTQSINSFGGLSDDFSGDGLRGSLTHKSSPTDEWTRWQNVEIFALGNYTDFIGLLKLRCFWQASWHSVKEYINSFFFNQYIRLKIHLYFYGPRTKHKSFCPWVGHYDVTSCLVAWFRGSSRGVSVPGPMFFLVRGLCPWSHVSSRGVCLSVLRVNPMTQKSFL